MNGRRSRSFWIWRDSCVAVPFLEVGGSDVVPSVLPAPKRVPFAVDYRPGYNALTLQGIEGAVWILNQPRSGPGYCRADTRRIHERYSAISVSGNRAALLK